MISALVVLKEGAQATTGDTIEFDRSKLAHFKSSREVRIIDEFPRSATGKILKPVFR